jgi:hypothetical protein
MAKPVKKRRTRVEKLRTTKKLSRKDLKNLKGANAVDTRANDQYMIIKLNEALVR